ncbi:MAG: ABC transporter ATP-binding protein, partial [Chloroflexi bacterium]|nr:ABC transporter ATP-binding protein [Chloroflexota bacterium]
MIDIDIELKDLSLAYGKNEVIHNISFQIERGSFVGLVGPNGSGKSTIIKSLSRIMLPTHGNIDIRGRDIAKIKQKDLALLVSVVPQSPLLPSAFTAFEIVLMGRNPHMGFFEYESEE